MQQNTVFPSLRACRATRPEAAMRQDMKRGTRALTNRSLSAESGSMGKDETGECVDEVGLGREGLSLLSLREKSCRASGVALVGHCRLCGALRRKVMRSLARIKREKGVW